METFTQGSFTKFQFQRYNGWRRSSVVRIYMGLQKFGNKELTHYDDCETLGTLLFRLGWDGRHMNGVGVFEWIEVYLASQYRFSYLWSGLTPPTPPPSMKNARRPGLRRPQDDPTPPPTTSSLAVTGPVAWNSVSQELLYAFTQFAATPRNWTVSSVICSYFDTVIISFL